MSKYPEITADQARALSAEGPCSPQESLVFLENLVGNAAETHHKNEVDVAFYKKSHSKGGFEYATLHMSTRGFTVTSAEEEDKFTANIKW